MELRIDQADLEPIVRTIVAEVLAALPSRDGDRIGLTESEAAERLGIARHVLRDCRLRGKIHARRMGKGYVYSVDEIRKFFAERENDRSRESKKAGHRDPSGQK